MCSTGSGRELFGSESQGGVMVNNNHSDLPDAAAAVAADFAADPTGKQITHLKAALAAHDAAYRSPHHPAGLAASIRSFVDALRARSFSVAKEAEGELFNLVFKIMYGKWGPTTDKFILACERVKRVLQLGIDHLFYAPNLAIGELTEILLLITDPEASNALPEKYSQVMRHHEAAKLFGITPRKVPEKLRKMNVRHVVLSRISIRIAEEDLPKKG
jgi:hypothetical protein